MTDFLSTNIAKTSKDRRNVKNQFGGVGSIDEYAVMKVENVIVKLSNLVVKVDGVEQVRRRFQWKDTSDFQKGTKSSNMRWDNGKLQIG